MAKNMLVGAKILKVNLRRSKLSRELFHVVSYRVILKMAGTKRICIGQVEPQTNFRFLLMTKQRWISTLRSTCYFCHFTDNSLLKN